MMKAFKTSLPAIHLPMQHLLLLLYCVLFMSCGVTNATSTSEVFATRIEMSSSHPVGNSVVLKSNSLHHLMDNNPKHSHGDNQVAAAATTVSMSVSTKNRKMAMKAVATAAAAATTAAAVPKACKSNKFYLSKAGDTCPSVVTKYYKNSLVLFQTVAGPFNCQAGSLAPGMKFCLP